MKRLSRGRRLTALLILLLFICNSLPSFALQSKALVTLKANNISIGKVLAEIKKQTGLIAFYNNKVLNDKEKIAVDFRQADVEDVMKSVLKGKSLQFEVNDKYILIKAANAPSASGTTPSSGQVVNSDITGKVIDEKGAPLPGVNVVVMGTKLATQTDADGQFFFQNIKENAVLTFSFIGYRSLQLTAKAKMKIKLEPTELNLKEVVYTGMGINRDAKTFTGATATYTGEQLKAIGNSNIIQSLKALDPSFIVVENNLKGSDPNSTPIIEIRGKTGAAGLSLNDEFGSDPNQPLFILDGFETSLQRIIDLDMNRIQSVVILKDAASTALYGSKAANGVVVVETVKPKEGKLRFSYTSDFSVDAPDLSVYNLMNSTEKLQFEKLAGRYTASVAEDQLALDESYSNHLAAVKQGVDTYWLNEPVQIGYTKNNSVSLSGGDQNLQYGVGFNYKMQDGVMKGSDRNSWGGNMNLVYRKSKLSITNNFSVSGTSNDNSPYGSFSTWAQQNPYYTKDPNAKWLEQTKAPALNSPFTIPLNVPNPLYNALLGSFDSGKGLDLSNSTNVKVELLPELRLEGGFQIAKSEGSTTSFTSPDNTMYENTDFTLKGKYINGKSERFSYTGNALLTFGKVLGKHSITANARTEISHKFNSALGTVFVGFPTGSNGNPRFAFGYDDVSGKPSASQTVYRTANALVSANYSYDRRFLFDGSYRLDGSTSYGTNNRMTPYYAAGIGWNLSNEKFIKDISWIDNLKLSSNMGVTGNQNFGSVASSSVYTFNPSYNKFGQALNLTTVANPDIKAQKTRQLSNNINFSLFNKKLGGYFQFYNKFTDNLVVNVSNASATGFSAHQENLGNLTTNGFEMRLTYNVIQNLKSRFIWTISATGSHTQSTYGGLGNKLSRLNATQEASKTYLRFNDGYSPSDIWAAKSLGIDPATGREMFLTPTGDYTSEYRYADIQRIGNSDPLIQGVITNAIRIKGFTVNMSMRYSQGKDIINTALFNKVENISYAQLSYNQDVRALYERWQKPGDIAQFKGISLTDATQMSSRFLQQENVFSLESISAGYTFENAKWIKNIGMNGLSFTAYTNDIFRISTVKNERGIDYPFARSVSFSLRASF